MTTKQSEPRELPMRLQQARHFWRRAVRYSDTGNQRASLELLTTVVMLLLEEIEATYEPAD